MLSQSPSASARLRVPLFWSLYAAVWFPYAASYTVVFVTAGGLPPGDAIAASAINTIPAALLGVVAVQLCRRIAWPSRLRARFFAVQLGFATLYAAVWVVCVCLLFTVVASLRRGEMTWRHLDLGAVEWTMFSGLMIYGTIASVCYTREIAARLREEEARAARLETLRTRAELEALRARLNPHFLFNTLHSLMALVRRDPGAAEGAIERLAALLRYVLDAGAGAARSALDDVLLEDELAFVETYLALEALRLGDRLRVERRIDPEALAWCIPALTVQPLVENAIKHAVAPRAGGGTLVIAAGVRPDGGLDIEIRDDGPGADPAAIAGSPGLGLRLVRQRLEARYRDAAVLAISTAPGAGFAVRMSWPLPVAPGPTSSPAGHPVWRSAP